MQRYCGICNPQQARASQLLQRLLVVEWVRVPVEGKTLGDMGWCSWLQDNHGFYKDCGSGVNFMDILESLKKKWKERKEKAYDLEYPTQSQSREPESFMGKK